jgi:hypothetical protein
MATKEVTVEYAPAAPAETPADVLNEIQLNLLRAIQGASSTSGVGIDVVFAGALADVYLKLFGSH